MPIAFFKNILTRRLIHKMVCSTSLGALILASFNLLACAPASSNTKTILRYQFVPGQTYRVTTSYQTFSGLEKFHGHRQFAKEEAHLAVKATYQVQALALNPQECQIEFKLLRLRLNHDGKGKCRLEMGPDGGRLTWYDDEWTLADYLGPELYAKYQKIMTQPLAVIVIDRQGHQLTQNQEKTVRTGLHLDLLELLSRNRVIGKKIIKAFKVPPLLMAVFPPQAVGPGDRWTSSSEDPTMVLGEEEGQTNRFYFRQQQQNLASIDCTSAIMFTGDELTELQKTLDMESLNKMTFQKGNYKIQGRVQFDLAKGLPMQGSLHTDKAYSFYVDQEKWESSEQETYQVNLTIE